MVADRDKTYRIMNRDKTYRIMISTVEVSGDLQGAQLIREIKRRKKDAYFYGLGGTEMESGGMTLEANLIPYSKIGLINLRNIYLFRRILSRMKKILTRKFPTVLVLINSPEINLPLARYAFRKKIPTVYYFPPEVWIWAPWKTHRVVKYSTRIITPFLQGFNFYQKAGGQVNYVGHPLRDFVKTRWNRLQTLQYFSLPDRQPIIGLLPGSREKEIFLHLPLLMESVKLLKKKLPQGQFLLFLASPFYSNFIHNKIATTRAEIKLVEKEKYEAMAICDLLICASGTSSLEAACLGVPLIVIYRLPRPSYLIARMLVKTPFISLPNLITGEEIVPELIQGKAHPVQIVELALKIMQNKNRELMVKNLKRVVSEMGPPGALGRAAEIILEVAKTGK